MRGQPTGAERFVIRVFNQIITYDQLTAWIAWKAADDAWRATRLYRAIFTAMVAAMIGAVAAIVAAVCQTALNIDPGSASKIDPLWRELVPVVHRGDPRAAECPKRG